MTADFQRLPSVDRVLADDRMQRASTELGRTTALEAARDEIAARRAALSNGGASLDFDAIVDAAVARAYHSLRPTLRPVINATGVIIHTNLGRAPLSDEAIAAMDAVNRGYSNLEYDLEAGERGSRYQHLEELICRVTGAEAAMAVNNNASALLLTLSALCRGREVVISRGQLVEIGGGFRIPDVMAQSGARLVEVGTTNRTYLRDYETASGEETAALMRVHSSNFRVIGFVTSPELTDMARQAHDKGLLLLDDLGSGCLLDTRDFGLLEEPTPQESLRAGADLVLFSGDKLLGGPQAGVMAGRSDLIDTLRRHPLARAVRMDKGSIAGLNATLLHYQRGEALTKVPVWRMISARLDEMEARATRLAADIGHGATVVDGRSMIGGGSLPEESLPSRLVALHAPDVESLARRLRLGTPAVVGRIEHDALLLDPRTVTAQDLEALVAAVRAALAG
jgi:L-seryl-tRNA(Ser) seleniumtransferase